MLQARGPAGVSAPFPSGTPVARSAKTCDALPAAATPRHHEVGKAVLPRIDDEQVAPEMAQGLAEASCAIARDEGEERPPPPWRQRHKTVIRIVEGARTEGERRW